MTDKHYDVIVIGAGLGGLSAAGYLAKSGKKVLVLEHHAMPGGYAHEFKRGKFRFEVALHAMDGLADGGWLQPVLQELGVLDRVHFHRLDPFYTAQYPNHEITVYNDPVRYRDALIRQFPHEAKGLTAMMENMAQVQDEVRKFSALRAKGEKISPMDVMQRYPHMALAMSVTWDAYMDRYISDPQLRGMFSVLWGYYGLPPSTLSAGLFILAWASYTYYGAWFPEGGSILMSRALEQCVREHGGEVLFNQTVKHIAVENNRVRRVETEKGLVAEADLIVSNASTLSTVNDLIGQEHFPEDYVAKVNAVKPAASNLVVYLGLDRDLKAEGYDHHELFLCTTYDVEESYRHMIEGRFDQTDLVVTYYSPVSQRANPPGYSTLAVMCLADGEYENCWGTGGNLENYRKNDTYNALKDRATNMIIDRLEKTIPNLRESIVKQETATPITNMRFCMNPAGSIYGSEQTVDNMFMNRLSQKTPIDNLVFSGAWVSGGGMSTAIMSGRNAAGIASRVLGQ